MEAYEDTIRHTRHRTPVVRRAADNKWFTRIVVAAAVVDALDSLDLRYPKLQPAAARARRGSKGAAVTTARG